MINFDFIYSFGQWMIDKLQPILNAQTYDPLNGSLYEFMIAYSIQYLTYLVFIIAVVVVASFALSLFINVFYKVKELF